MINNKKTVLFSAINRFIESDCQSDSNSSRILNKLHHPRLFLQYGESERQQRVCNPSASSFTLYKLNLFSGMNIVSA